MHHDPDLQRHVHETGNHKRTITLLKRWRWFGLFVMLPSLLATIYYGFIAADVYVSESRFVIKAPDQKAGGGGSMALTEARESLVACCTAVLQTRLEAGDSERCAQVLEVAAYAESPALASLAAAAEECLRRVPREVAASCAARGVADVGAALRALNDMRGQGKTI